jgi:hypothetical protein
MFWGLDSVPVFRWNLLGVLETETSSLYWTHLSRLYLSMYKDFSL